MPAASRTSLLPAWAIAYNALVWGISWLPLQHLQGQGLHPLWSTALMYSLPMLSLLLWRPQLLREFAGQRDLCDAAFSDVECLCTYRHGHELAHLYGDYRPGASAGGQLCRNTAPPRTY